MITSTANKKVKEIISINKKPSYRKKSRMFIVEGIKMFQELDKNRIEEIYMSESFYNNIPDDFAFKIKKMRYEIVSDKVFSSFSDTSTPQGILALVRQYEYRLEDILNKKYLDRERKHNLLILEGIQDPGNLGTMIRAGEGAGITGIIMDENTVDIYNSKVIRSTMGSIFRIPYIYVENLENTIDVLKSEGISIYAAILSQSKPYESMNYKKDSAFMIGNESKGLSESIIKKADENIKIDLLGNVESLNAAVAASILMYELSRQRRV